MKRWWDDVRPQRSAMMEERGMGYGPVEDLEVVKMAERACDRIYELVQVWPSFDKETLGRQLVRAADSIGANIVEGYGRYHYGDQLRFLYIARGSLFETTYWLRRAHKRHLINDETLERAITYLDELRRKLNLFIKDRRNRQSSTGQSNNDKVTEHALTYDIRVDTDGSTSINQDPETFWGLWWSQTDEVPIEAATSF